MRVTLFSQYKPKWLQAFLLIAFLLGAFGVNLPVVHAIYPEYLHKGRTYDQERDYIEWHGSVNYVNLYHRDNTSKPASEGGASCARGCTEQVTRIHDGASISGNFTFLEGFSVQAAYSGNSNVGRVIVKACGKTVFNQDLYTPGASVPGFNNLPAPEWSVPTSGDCTWSITASGGYVDVRAVDATPRTATAPPEVDLKINGSDGPVDLTVPASPALSWTSSQAASCIASGDWSGSKATNDSEIASNLPAGSYTYTLTCTNSAGSASDTVVANVYGSLDVDVKVNGQDGPLALIEPADYTLNWTSSDAGSCQAEGSLSGVVELDGSRDFSGVLQGDYTYTIRCTNAVGEEAIDSVQVQVNPRLPEVDLWINGSDGPLTLASPADYTLSWRSQYADSCSAASASGDWEGSVSLIGSSVFFDVVPGSRSYTLTCTNVSGSASDSVSVTVQAPLSGTISPLYARLLLFGPNLGQPAQTLLGAVTGGEPPYSVTVSIRSPFGSVQTYSLSGANWSLSPEAADDPNLGVSERGAWTAWADIRDSRGNTYQTTSVPWEVAWLLVHGRP